MRSTNPAGAVAMNVEGYEILTPLASYGRLARYEANERATGRPVTLELPYAHALTSPEWRDDFRDRLHALALLDHPHLEPILGVGPHEYGAYLVRGARAAGPP